MPTPPIVAAQPYSGHLACCPLGRLLQGSGGWGCSPSVIFTVVGLQGSQGSLIGDAIPVVQVPSRNRCSVLKLRCFVR